MGNLALEGHTHIVSAICILQDLMPHIHVHAHVAVDEQVITALLEAAITRHNGEICTCLDEECVIEYEN